MPEPIDPANARLALRRLARSLLGRDAGEPPHDGDVAAWLDTHERADYEQVVAALSGTEPQRFGVIDRWGWKVVDLAECMTPHGTGHVELVAEFPGEMAAKAAATILNAHPDEWDAAPKHEPF